ncbi:MAG TPA: hypothetical protein VG537_08850 [Candidatus Kapabacteria bacterium]|nr:hypothetical protein [Candidatus Kapabacteria bacterium]
MDRASAQSTIDSLQCSRTLDTLKIGGVLFGGSVQDTIEFFNQFSNPSDSIVSFEFVGDTSLRPDISQLHIVTEQAAFFTFQYRPSDSAKHSAFLIVTITTDSAACVDTILVQAPAIVPTKDTATFSIIPSPQDVIAIRSSTNISSLTIYLKNETTASHTIDTVRLTGLGTISISSHPSFPVTLATHDSLRLSLTFSQVSPGFVTGDLVIVMPDEPILQDAIAVQGLRLPDAAVTFIPSGSIYFWLYPNPSEGIVTLRSEGIVHTHVKLINVLGITLRDEDFNQDWMLNTYSATPEPGTYFVIVSGITPDGMPVHEVKRLVILH